MDPLSRESPAVRLRGALDRLATMWSGDEALLQTDPELFDALGGLSVVTRTELGLAVAEPFRTGGERLFPARFPAGLSTGLVHTADPGTSTTSGS